MHVHIINNNTVVPVSFNNLVLDMYYSTQFYYVQLHAFTFFFLLPSVSNPHRFTNKAIYIFVLVVQVEYTQI